MNIMMKLSDAGNYGFDSGTLSTVFDSLHNKLNRATLPIEHNWMVDEWIRIVNESYAPQLDLEQPSDQASDNKPE